MTSVEKKVGEENGMHGKSVTDFMTDDEVLSWKKNISESTKGVPKEKIECPHCGVIGAPHVMKRWHFDNCRKKNKIDAQ